MSPYSLLPQAAIIDAFLVDTQYTDGISGALIVHPSDPAPKGFPTWDEDLVVELSDVYHTFSTAIVGPYLSVRYTF